MDVTFLIVLMLWTSQSKMRHIHRFHTYTHAHATAGTYIFAPYEWTGVVEPIQTNDVKWHFGKNKTRNLKNLRTKSKCKPFFLSITFRITNRHNRHTLANKPGKKGLPQASYIYIYFCFLLISSTDRNSCRPQSLHK